MRQVLLASGLLELVAWVDEKKSFRVGDRVTLKNHPEPDRLWTVMDIYGSRQLKDIHTDWRVGGLT